MSRLIVYILLGFISIVSVQAQSWLDSALNILQKDDALKANTVIVQILDVSFLQKLKVSEKKYDSVVNKTFEKLIEKVPTLPVSVQAIVRSHVGAHLISQGKLKEGHSQLQQARSLARTTKGFPLFIYFDTYSKVFSRISRLDSAVFYAKKMLDHSIEMHNDSLEHIALQRVGSLCYDIQQYQQASQYFKTIVKRNTNEIVIRNYYNAIGLCFRNQGIYDSARFYLDKALTLAVKYDTVYIALINGNIGDTYFREGRFEEAIPYLQIELKLSSPKQMTKIGIDCLNTLTTAYIHLHDLKNADRCYSLLSKHVAESWSYAGVALNFYQLSAYYFQKKKDFEKAIHFSNLYQNLNDSTNAVKNIQRASEVSTQYDFDHQREQISFLNQQNLLQQAENRQKNYLLFGSLFIILLIASLLILVFNNYKQKRRSLSLIQQQKDGLEKLNEELLTSLEKIEEQNQKISGLVLHLKEVNVSKDKLFSIIGHDLRNPINSLKGLLKLASADQVTQDEFKSFSGKLNEGMEHIDFTLNNMLQWAHTQMQGITVNPQTIDLYDHVIENINFLVNVAKSKKIKLTNCVPEKTLVVADANQVNLVIRNLMSNAIKFTPENGCVIIKTTTNGNSAEVCVEDNGVGISDDIKANLFKADYHITTHGTQGEKGSGLGLLLCHEMIEKNKGKIGVKNSEAGGSTFWFTLPTA